MRLSILTIVLCVFLSSCLEERPFTYYLDFNASDDQRAVISDSLQEWGYATGIDASEVDDPEQSTIVIAMGEVPADKIAYARWTQRKYFDAKGMEIIEYLDRATIILKPIAWDLNYDSQLKLLNHEIGHILTDSGHTPECPSTMNAYTVGCGTETIDAISADLANRKIDNGWLSKLSLGL